MDRLTLIVVADHREPVRRFQVPRSWVRRGPWVAAVVVLLVGLALVDWVKLRLDAVDVARLRAETQAHQAALESLHGQLATLESQFGRVLEFERKVRVIADLPGAMVEAQLPDPVGGQGGSVEDGPAEPAPEAWEGLPGGRGGDEGLPPVGAGTAAAFDAALLAGTLHRGEALAARLEVQAESLEALIEGLRGKSERLASTPSIWPTEGWVTSGYGNRISPFTGKRQFHAGLDIAARFGTEVIAPARGRVVFAGRQGAFGKMVKIDHGHGLRTLYGHTAEIFVRRGQEVERGTRIASVGSTGRSTGPHLHYAITVGGKTVDPSQYIIE